jgi:hypothetical protein
VTAGLCALRYCAFPGLSPLFAAKSKTGSRYPHTSEMRKFLNDTDVVHLQHEIVLIPESKYDPVKRRFDDK